MESIISSFNTIKKLSASDSLSNAASNLFNLIHWQSSAFKELLRQAQHIAQHPQQILIQGPEGSGKKTLAHYIHQHSAYPNMPMIEIECAAIAEHLLELDLFGHTQGAFPGAIADRDGYFETANFGTIVFNNIDLLAPNLQSKLLEILDHRTFKKIGESTERKFYGRIIATTSTDLATLVTQGRFQKNLYHRLTVLILTLPSLSQHQEDIPLLIDFFASRQPKKIKFTSEAINLLLEADWDGNIRALRNLIDRLSVLCHDTTITPESLQKFLLPPITSKKISLDQIVQALLALDGADKLFATESLLIHHVLYEHQFNKTLTAKALGISKLQLEETLKRHEDNEKTTAQAIEQAAQLIDQANFSDAINILEQTLPKALTYSKQKNQRIMLFNLYHLLGISYRSHQGWLSQESQAAYLAALSIGCQLDNDIDITPLLFGVWSTQLMMLDLKKAHQTGQSMLQHAILHKDQKAIADAYFAMANTLFWMGDCKGVLNYLQRGKLTPATPHEYKISQGIDLITLAITFEGLANFQLGNFEAAQDALQHLLLRSTAENHHHFNRAVALQGATWLACLFDNQAQLKQLSTELEALAKTHNFPFYQGIGEVFIGCSLIHEQRYAEAKNNIKHGYQSLMLINGGKLFHSFQAWKLAEALLLSNDALQADTICNQAIDVALSCDERVYLSELFTTQARAKIMLQQHDEAITCFETALSGAFSLDSLSAKIYTAIYYMPYLIEKNQHSEALKIAQEIFPDIPKHNNYLCNMFFVQYNKLISA